MTSCACLCLPCRVNLRFLAEVQTLAWMAVLLLLYWMCAGLFMSAPAAVEGGSSEGLSASAQSQFAHLGAGGQHAHGGHTHAHAGNVHGHSQEHRHVNWQQHHYMDDQEHYG